MNREIIILPFILLSGPTEATPCHAQQPGRPSGAKRPPLSRERGCPKGGGEYEKRRHPPAKRMPITPKIQEFRVKRPPSLDWS